MVNPGRHRPGQRGSQRGVSIVEVLVTLLTASLALLGTVGLQAYSLRLNQAAQHRIQAVLLVADLVERLEANKAGAIAGLYLHPADSAKNCVAQSCSSADLAAYDLAQWHSAVIAALPNATTQLTRAEAGMPSTYTIRIGWADRRSNGSDGVAGAGSAFFGSGQRFVYTASRTISEH
ncbi:MAG: type IV pilus modification protein PilV [Burkholderiaceae bacterium]